MRNILRKGIALLLVLLLPNMGYSVVSSSIVVTVTVSSALSINIPSAAFSFGSGLLSIGGAGSIATRAFIVSNDSGGLVEDIQLSATQFGTGGSPAGAWSFSQTLTPAADSIVMAGIFLSPGQTFTGGDNLGSAEFGVEDIISNAAKIGSTGYFTSNVSSHTSTNADGNNIDAFGLFSELSLRLWIQLPTSSSYGVSNPTTSICVTALNSTTF